MHEWVKNRGSSSKTVMYVDLLLCWCVCTLQFIISGWKQNLFYHISVHTAWTLLLLRSCAKCCGRGGDRHRWRVSVLNECEVEFLSCGADGRLLAWWPASSPLGGFGSSMCHTHIVMETVLFTAFCSSERQASACVSMVMRELLYFPGYILG